MDAVLQSYKVRSEGGSRSIGGALQPDLWFPRGLDDYLHLRGAVASADGRVLSGRGCDATSG